MHCRIWHVKPLDEIHRTTFELIEWPFFHGPYGPIPDKLLNYFQELTIVRLELEGKSVKFMLPLKEEIEGYEGLNPLEWNGKPFNIYRSGCQLDDDDLTVLAWDKLNPDFSKSVLGRSEDIPDNACWLEWNNKLRVVKMDSNLVQGV